MSICIKETLLLIGNWNVSRDDVRTESSYSCSKRSTQAAPKASSPTTVLLPSSSSPAS